MKIPSIALLILLCLSPLLQAGTPDFQMWGGHKQDALILGEVVEKPSPLSNTVRIMAVFPQTTPFWREELKVGQVIMFEGGNLALSSKYLMSLMLESRLYGALHGNPEVMQAREKQREAQGKYKATPKWGIHELPPDSTGFADARIVAKEPLRDDLQLMVSSGGKYLSATDVFPDPPQSLTETQIPADLLKQIPTRELINIWLEYPHITLVHAYNTPQQGMDKLRATFNGLPELLQRKDTADALFTAFGENRLSDFPAIMGEDNIQRFIHQQTALSLLLAQPEILAQLPFYQRYYLHWQVAQRLDAMRTMPALKNSTVTVCYQVLADNLKKD